MVVAEYARANFNTLLHAATSGDLALVECADVVTGEPRYAISTIARDGAEYTIALFGHLAPSNPYEACEPPRIPQNLGQPARGRE